MFAVDGYEPLTIFLRTAFRSVWDKVQKEYVRRRLDETAKEDGQIPKHWHYFNAQCAAQFLVYDLFETSTSTGPKRVQLLRPDGVRLSFPLKLLKPAWSVSPKSQFGIARSAETARRGKDPVFQSIPVFDLETLSHDYWVVPFLESQAFDNYDAIQMHHLNRNIERYLPVINWETGCIDLTAHRLYADAVSGFRSGFKAISRINVVPPANIERLIEGSFESENFIASMLPFDGCSIIAPEEWLQTIRQGSSTEKVDECSDASLHGPRDMIVSILETDPKSNKASVKKQIMSAFRISNRKFDQFWSSVAEEKPHIQLPGRKSSRRIETLS